MATLGPGGAPLVGNEPALYGAQALLPGSYGTAYCVVIALSQPQFGVKREKAKKRGAEIVLTIDTSASMSAGDVKPNRLQAAKDAAGTIIARLTNDRVAIVVFAGKAYKYCPLTIDHDAALMFLDSIGFDSSPQPGTALADALDIAGEIFQQAEGKYRAVVLLSDGEDHGSGALRAANRLNRESGAKLMVLGVGTREGDPMPLLAADGTVTDYKRDEKGQVIISRLMEKELRSLASAGNGLYKRLSEPSSIAQISARLESLEGIRVGTYVYTDYAQRFQWPLLVAILLFVIESLIAEQRFVPRRRGEIAED